MKLKYLLLLVAVAASTHFGKANENIRDVSLFFSYLKVV